MLTLFPESVALYEVPPGATRPLCGMRRPKYRWEVHYFDYLYKLFIIENLNRKLRLIWLHKNLGLIVV